MRPKPQGIGLNASQIYQWRTDADKKANTSTREGALATEGAKLKRQLAEQTEEISIQKRRLPTSRKPKFERLKFIQDSRAEFNATGMVKALSVSRSGYYAWLKAVESLSPRQLQRIERDEQVKMRGSSAMAPVACR